MTGPRDLRFAMPDGAPAGLVTWWMSTAYKDLVDQLPKMSEYGGAGGGSADLRLMGDNLAELLRWTGAADPVKQELAVWFYLQGKTARLVSNYQQRQPGKPDTWHDCTVYSMIARRLQQGGRWP